MTLKIVADAAIPFAGAYFSSIGELTLVNGRDITPAAVHDADVLVTRTVTRVDETLLRDSAVRFVASATSGMDHVDREFLESRDIGFGYAPGCNARSVAEYVLSSLFVLSDQSGFDLSAKRVGIVGCGHVGSMVLKLLQAMDVQCLVCDPPLKEQGVEKTFHDLEQVLAADVVTLHVPLTGGGKHPTRNLLDSASLDRLGNDVIFINTSRGGVVDEAALQGFLERHPRASAVIDVWENEPDINTGLLERAAIATPHIAGYSTDGKLKGTRMVYQQVCHYFDLDAEDITPTLPQGGVDTLILDDPESIRDALQMAVLACYDVRSDSISLRRILDIAARERGVYFDDLRNHYPLRREFPAMRVELRDPAGETGRKLTALGFEVKAG